MTVRLPDRLFRPLDRIVTDRRRLRRAESDEGARAHDAALRVYYAELHRRHDAGTCGGAATGCPYAPCVLCVEEGVQ